MYDVTADWKQNNSICCERITGTNSANNVSTYKYINLYSETSNSNLTWGLFVTEMNNQLSLQVMELGKITAEQASFSSL